VGHLVEEGTPIGITRRDDARISISNIVIADPNIKGYLKPKGMTTNRWC
jgi:hypothetical protein